VYNNISLERVEFSLLAYLGPHARYNYGFNRKSQSEIAGKQSISTDSLEVLSETATCTFDLHPPQPARTSLGFG
jgi:hypothetical protein